jgi:transposase-like protein
MRIDNVMRCRAKWLDSSTMLPIIKQKLLTATCVFTSDGSSSSIRCLRQSGMRPRAATCNMFETMFRARTYALVVVVVVVVVARCFANGTTRL